MITRWIKRMAVKRDEGMALLLAIISVTIMGFIGASFALMLSNETKSAGGNILAQKALFVAESGIQDVLFQRQKMPDQMCFPFFFHSTQSVVVRLNQIKAMTGARSGGATLSASDSTTDVCNPDSNNIPSTPNTKEDLPCWPYNEKLYANTIHWGPWDPNTYTCHDGSDQSNPGCETYSPYLWWPAKSDGSIGWKDWDEKISGSKLPLNSEKESSGARYTTGFFTLCNDDFRGITSADPGYDKACSELKNGTSSSCEQSVIRLTIVSIGEVQMGDKIVRRAVKTDLAPPALYSGVIDKYIDLTLLLNTTIHGPIHINGWKMNDKWNAFLVTASLMTGLVGLFVDAPDMVSVSFPEDTPDWQPKDLLGMSFDHDIVYVHLPVRIEIPSVNWDKWENRMKSLYKRAKNEYSDATVYPLKYCKFDANVTAPVWNCTTDLDPTIGQGGQDENIDNIDFLKFTCPPNTNPDFRGDRIHNCNRSNYQLWNSATKHIFDLFDQWDAHPNDYVEGTEDQFSATDGGGNGPRDASLKLKVKFILNPHFDFGCAICVGTKLFSGGFSFEDIISCCVGEKENRYAFAFAGKHEFRDFVFIDGAMGMGMRTPYHTCGDGDGGLGIYCVQIPEICAPWPLDSLCIPAFQFGMPHWHLGSALVTGEVLVNGRLYMADWIRIQGGALYTAGHIIKDESSGYDITLHLDKLICAILKWVGIPLTLDLGLFSIDLCPFLMWPINLIMSGLGITWWPDLDLTNNSLIDFATYLDIDGAPNAFDVVNPGTIYTRGDFRLLPMKWDFMSAIMNLFLGWLLDGALEMNPAMDPIRIFNGGAIVAGGTDLGDSGGTWFQDQTGKQYYQRYANGNIYLGEHLRADILTCKPDDPDDTSHCEELSNGYVLARGSLGVNSDIISHYGNVISGEQSCSPKPEFHLPPFENDPDCSAQGIFYSGGIAQGSYPMAAFTRRGLTLEKNGFDYDMGVTCLSPEESAFWTPTSGILDNITCLAGAALDDLKALLAIDRKVINEFNIRGHIFAGQVGGLGTTSLELEQDGSVRSDAVTRQYFKQLGGVPIDWMQVNPPADSRFALPEK